MRSDVPASVASPEANCASWPSASRAAIAKPRRRPGGDVRLVDDAFVKELLPRQADDLVPRRRVGDRAAEHERAGFPAGGEAIGAERDGRGRRRRRSDASGLATIRTERHRDRARHRRACIGRRRRSGAVGLARRERECRWPGIGYCRRFGDLALASLRTRSAGGRAISGTTVATAAASNPPAAAIIPHVAKRFIVGSSRGSSPRQKRAHVAK